MTFDTLVLSGNSTNAVVTLGALQYLYENNVIDKQKITTMVGTSSGSLVASLLAIDYEPIDILCFICVNKSYSKVSGMNFANISSGSIMKYNAIEDEMINMFMSKIGYVPTLKQIYNKFGKKLVFTTYNMTDNVREYITHENYPNLSVISAGRMSSTFPFVFSPYEYEGKYYVDGGIVDNFPMTFAQTIGTNCLGIYNATKQQPYTPNTTFTDLFLKLFAVFVESAAENVYINSRSIAIKLTYEPNFFNFNCSNETLINSFDVGYDSCKESYATLK